LIRWMLIDDGKILMDDGCWWWWLMVVGC